jgi:hypothetical protein
VMIENLRMDEIAVIDRKKLSPQIRADERR